MDQPLKPPTEIPSIGTAPTRRSGRSFFLTVLTVLLLIAGVVWWGRQQTAQQPSGGGGGRFGNAPMSIVPETASKGDIGVTLNGLGTVTSLATVTIRTQISG
jgi:multidrug efflux system membrane fusion protein